MEQNRQQGEPECGFVLIAVLFLVALILIALAVAAPKMAKEIQRDKELELLHRGQQYQRAIKLYYKKFGSYPVSIDQLITTNQTRFLRKRYKDPMTGKDDWKLIYFGQAHVQPMGLFGQPLAGTGLAGAAGGVGQPIAGSTTGSNNTSTSAFGSSSGSSFGSSSGSSFGGSSSGGSSFGSSGNSGFGSSGTSGSGFGSSSGTTTGSTDGSNSGFGSSGSTTPGGTSTGAATGSGTGSAFGSTGSTGSTLNGGGPIVGVAIPDTRASMKEYKKQKHYNEWEFVYNPLEDQLQGALGGGQQNLNGATPVGASSGTGFSSNIGGATLINGGQNSGFPPSSGTNGGTTTTPPPQQ